MNEILLWLKTQAQTNNIFSGVIAAGGITSILYAIKNWGLTALKTISELFTVTIKVKGNSEAFKHLENWMVKSKYVNSKFRCRNMRLISDLELVSENSVGDDGKSVSQKVTVGDGKHVIFYRGILTTITRNTTPSGGRYGGEMESYTISMVSFSKRPMYKFLEDLAINGTTSDVHFYQWTGEWWNSFARRTPRSAETLYYNEGTYDKIESDLTWFKKSKKWYVDRGIPYRRGYLFSGAPGTGKTSAVSAMSNKFGMNVAILDIKACDGDNGLLTAFNNLPYNTILLIEDIDAVYTSNIKCRKKNVEKPDTDSDDDDDNTSKKGKKDTNKATLGGLLNGLDGIAYKDGTIVVMTTNHPELLDHALIRPGRVGLHVNFTEANKQTAERMFCGFYADTDLITDTILSNFKKYCPEKIQQAKLQEFMIANKNSPSIVVDELKKLHIEGGEK